MLTLFIKNNNKIVTVCLKFIFKQLAISINLKTMINYDF